MNNLTVRIDKEEFLKKPVGEQNWVLYEAAVGEAVATDIDNLILEL